MNRQLLNLKIYLTSFGPAHPRQPADMVPKGLPLVMVKKEGEEGEGRGYAYLKDPQSCAGMNLGS